MTHDEWMDQYKPIRNPYNDSPLDRTMWETFGEEFEHVKRQEPEKVWTIVEADGEWWLATGMHFVNRIGYCITEVAFDPQNPPDDIFLED